MSMDLLPAQLPEDLGLLHRRYYRNRNHNLHPLFKFLLVNIEYSTEYVKA